MIMASPTLQYFAGWDDEGDDIHVYPMFGREHECSRDCWCRPKSDEENPIIFVHNLEN